MITTTDDGWARESSPVFRAANAPSWIVQDAPQQCRDPFVMVDPDDPGKLLMYYVAANALDPDPIYPHNAVGVARNRQGSLDLWDDQGYFRSTDSQNSGGVRNAESPHVFPDPDYPFTWPADQAHWRLMFTDGPNPDATRSIRFLNKVVGESLSDTTLAYWPPPAENLYSYLGTVGEDAPFGWEATEYLRAGIADFLAAYNGIGIAITRLDWTGQDFRFVTPTVAGAGDRESPAEAGPRLIVTELVPGSPRVGLRLELPVAMAVNLTIYDVLGRRVRRLLDGPLPRGSTALVWDGHDAGGAAARTGMYFARLASPKGNRVLRLPLIR
jgi:hypothetical protein